MSIGSLISSSVSVAAVTANLSPENTRFVRFAKKSLCRKSCTCYSRFMAPQLVFDLPKWGGRRKGAGRPRTRAHPGLNGPGVPHTRKAEIASSHPLHITQRVQPGVGYL